MLILKLSLIVATPGGGETPLHDEEGEEYNPEIQQDNEDDEYNPELPIDEGQEYNPEISGDMEVRQQSCTSRTNCFLLFTGFIVQNFYFDPKQFTFMISQCTCY